ncbi:MAG: hypothetical protein ACSHXW_07095 [Yoonia sp.]
MTVFLRWILLFAAMLVLTAIFEPPLMQFFADQGWHDQDKIAGDLLNWLARIVGAGNFPWIAGTTLGLAIGSWAHWFASKLDSKIPSKADEFGELAFLIENVTDEWINGFRDEVGNTDFTRFNYKTDLRRKVLYGKLKKVGIKPPDFSQLPKLDANIGHYSFMRALAPFSQYGMLAEAKAEAKKNHRRNQNDISDTSTALSNPKYPLALWCV